MEKFNPVFDSIQSPFSEVSEASSPSRLTAPRISQPWRHSVSKHGPPPVSRTVREFRPRRQRGRLLAKSFVQWCITLLLCGMLAACLGGFGNLLWLSVHNVKTFNALIVLISLLLGNNLTSSLRDYAQMLRWRLLAARYRPLHEFDLLMNCDSLRKVMELFWHVRTPGLWSLNKTQWYCTAWLSVNLFLQVLVALLGLTYNLDTATIPARRFGHISVADFSIVRDVWASKHPTFQAQLGSANSYGVQGQDYNFITATIPGQGKIPSYGNPSTPTVYVDDETTNMQYVFQDQNVQTPDLTLLSRRSVNSTAICSSLEVVEGGDGYNTVITFLDEDQQQVSIDVAHVGPGAMTYIGVLNSTCGPRCTQVLALQSADGDIIPSPSFYRCANTFSPVTGLSTYLIDDDHNSTIYEVPDLQARILAGAIGWSGFPLNSTTTDPDDYSTLQSVRYAPESWWSPDFPANATIVARRVMEFSIEAVAAFDYNGPRRNVTGWYPIPAQRVIVEWRWAIAILAVIPAIQLLALFAVLAWANDVIIRDGSCLSTARLLRPVAERLGDTGCLLSGGEIAEELVGLRVKYGWREPHQGFTFSNSLDAGDVVRHVDVLEESEGYGPQGRMPEGRYDGLEPEGDGDGDEDHNDARPWLRRRPRPRRRALSS